MVLKTESKGKGNKRIRMQVVDADDRRPVAPTRPPCAARWPASTATGRGVQRRGRLRRFWPGWRADVLGPDRALAVTAVSPSLAPSELADCRTLAAAWGLRWMEVATDEGSRPGYVANGPDRCYHCKSELMDSLAPIAAAEDAVVALGVNVDDLGDHRPGQRAARERGAVFPLVEAGFTKAARAAGRPRPGPGGWDKPAAACLASRVPYGTPVTLGTLGQVAQAEEALRAPRLP